MKEQEFTFSATFSLPSPSSDLKVPIDAEKLYRATLKGPLIKDSPYGLITLIYKKVCENDKEPFCFSDFFYQVGMLKG